MLAFSSWSSAAPPDLTAPGVIAGIDRSQTYNLGPTGLRGWIYLSGGSGNTHGADGTMTGESRQILVTVASAPANAVLAVDDVILGALAAGSGTVPLFTSDARKAFGAAITEAERTGAGTLRVKRWRAGTTTDENIPITMLGDYAASAPYSCPKSSLILANARNKLVSQLKADANFLTSDWKGGISGLALLAGVQPGDPDYATVQTRLQTYARARATAGPVDNGLPIWDWGYLGLFLAEYYLATGDPNVLAGINSFTLKLSISQSINGTYGHGPSVLRPDGSGRRMNTGYGPVNSVGIVANMAIVMGKKALLAGGQAIDPEIDGAIQRGSDFFAFYVNKGPIPYGEHEPFISGHSSNGKDPMCAVLFGLQAGRAVETEYYARMTTASYRGREYGHTGQGFSYLWSAMGANMGGALAVAEHLKQVRWHLDLSRRTDGSFAYDGAEQYGGGETSDDTYLGASGYYGMNATASYILTFALPLQRLYITGKRDTPANPPPLTLDAATVAHAIAAANFKVDSPGFSNAQLINALSDYDPVVRHYAAIELGKSTRTLTTTELTTLRAMVTGTDANGRMGACQALGLRQDSTALPTIVQRLDKTTETDLWVRAKAASAIRSYTPATASTHRDTMLTRFTGNATDPDVIVWSDPIQMSNNFLSLALFGDAIYGGNSIRDYTVNAAKNLLHPAVQTGLKQPDSYSRSGASRFCYDKLPLTDVQALFPDFKKVIEIECLADRMWSADSRANGIKTFSKYKISEGIPYALAMLDIPEGFEWGSDTTLIAGLNALAAYGDAARWTLPKLREYLGEWSPTSSQYPTLVSTIALIENAITAPAQAPGLAVANSQVVAATGAKAITLTGSSPRGAVTFTHVTAPAHGTLTGSAPNLTYTPHAYYTGPDSFTFQVIDSLGVSYPSAPGTVSIIVGAAGTGLKGEYFDNMDFTNLKLTRTDAQVNFDWGTGSPNAALGADTFSVLWNGLLLVPETATYTFSTLNSDGVRLYVNGVLMINDYTDQSTNWKDGATVNLTAGQMVDLHLRYYENTGSAVAKLKWTGPSFAGANGAIIGSQWLYDGTGMARTPYAHSQSVTLIRNTPQPVTLTGSGGTLAYAILTPPAHGTLTGTAPYLTYTPAANYSGTDSFTFLVNNGTSNSNPATVSLGVWAGQPVTYTWSTATTGNWSVGTNWTGGTAPEATGQPFYNLNFAPAGTYTATHDLSGGFAFNQLNFAGAVTLSGTNGIAPVGNGPLLPTINQNSASAVTISVPVGLTAPTSVGGTGAGQVTLTGLISGAGGLIKDSLGTLRVHGYDVAGHTAAPNTFSGGTTINSGTLIWGTMDGGISPPINAALGTGPVTINPGGILEFERVDNALNALICNGGTVYSNNGWGAKWGGPVTLNAVTTVDATWNMTFNGNISGAGGFTTKGGRIVTLSGTNSFTGPNKITAGTLTCTKAAALGTGSLDIATGAKVNLNFTGTRTIAALTYNGGAPLAPGTYGSTASPATNKTDAYFSGAGTVTILPPTTTTLVLTSGTTPAAPGSPLTFTATVSGSTPTGSVAFYAGTTLLGSGTLNGSFQASLTTSSLATGSHNITAQYAGNAANGTSTSAAVAVEIISLLPPAPTNLLAAAGNHRVGLTWTVSAGATSYYVKRSPASGGPFAVIGNSGSASFDDLTAVNGTTYYYVVSAINASGESADSNQVTGVPGPQPSGTSLVSAPVATGPYGAAVTFTATVTVSGGPATGSVTFRDGATVLGSGTLDGAGQASLTASTLTVASHAITATYEGDGTFGGSVSAPLAYVVAPKALTITGVTASDKTYDGTLAAVLSGGAVAGGVVGGETVTVIPGEGAFASPNAGTWPVTATGYTLGGADAGNYALATQPTVPNATITPRPVQVTGTRPYDGTTIAPASVLAISNKVSGDDLTLAGSASLAAKDAGPRATVTNFATPARVQHATGSTGSTANPTFNVSLTTSPLAGNTLIAVISTRGNSANRVSAISGGGVTWSRVSQATNTGGATTEIWYGPNVSSGTTGITITQASLVSAAVVIEYGGLLVPTSFDLAANNTGSNSSAATGTTGITSQPNELWMGGIGIRDGRRTLNAPYGNDFTVVALGRSGSASGDSTIYALEKIVAGTGAAGSGGTLSASDTWSGAIATFKAGAAGDLTISGPAAANYTLTGLTGVVEIAPKPLTITADNQDKTYGQTLAFGSGATQFASSGLVDGETIGSVTLTCAGGDAAAGVAGSPYPITPSAATGGSFSAANYAINYVSGVLTVSPAATTTMLATSGSPTTYGVPVTLTATVAPAADGGTVQFHDHGVALGSLVPLSGGQAQLVISTLTAGAHSLTATYSGGTNHHGSTATAMTQMVDKATPTITTPPAATEITYGQTLASSTLSGGAASVPGTFAFTDPAIAPPAGTASHGVTFTPADLDNYQSATTSVSVTVNPALAPFEAWAADPAQGLTAGVNDAPLDDPDHDGFSNLLEFALGGAPMVPSPAIQPQLTLAAGAWVFSYERSNLAKFSTTQVVEQGSDLAGWTPLTIPAESAGDVTITPGASADCVDVNIPPPGAQRFVRLKVSH
jgi:hypothetical protein